MSFSGDVKEELLRHYGSSRHCQIAELSAIVSFSGTDIDSLMKNEGPADDAGSDPAARKCFTLLEKTFNIVKRADVEQDRMLRLTDENQKLKLVIASSSVVYIAAEENYVRIHYYEGIRLKDYALRNSMKAVETLVEGKGLVRCHRSYMLNPLHVKALSKGKEGVIEAEMDAGCPPVPVSKRYYDNLSSLL